MKDIILVFETFVYFIIMCAFPYKAANLLWEGKKIHALIWLFLGIVYIIVISCIL